jgi:hypothetical protein
MMRRCTGLSPSPEEGQGAVEHHVHGVVEVGALGVFAERDLLETVENGSDGVVHRLGVGRMASSLTAAVA